MGSDHHHRTWSRMPTNGQILGSAPPWPLLQSGRRQLFYKHIESGHRSMDLLPSHPSDLAPPYAQESEDQSLRCLPNRLGVRVSITLFRQARDFAMAAFKVYYTDVSL